MGGLVVNQLSMHVLWAGKGGEKEGGKPECLSMLSFLSKKSDGYDRRQAIYYMAVRKTRHKRLNRRHNKKKKKKKFQKRAKHSREKRAQPKQKNGIEQAVWEPIQRGGEKGRPGKGSPLIDANQAVSFYVRSKKRGGTLRLETCLSLPSFFPCLGRERKADLIRETKANGGLSLEEGKRGSTPKKGRF